MKLVMSLALLLLAGCATGNPLTLNVSDTAYLDVPMDDGATSVLSVEMFDHVGYDPPIWLPAECTHVYAPHNQLVDWCRAFIDQAVAQRHVKGSR